MITTSSSCAPPRKEKYLRWLAAEFPRYLEAYEQAYAGRVLPRGRYRERIDARVRAPQREARLPGGRTGPRRVDAEQLPLF